MVLRGQRKPAKGASGIITPEEFRVLLREDFRTFVHRAFVELNPGAAFQPAPYIDLLCSRLMACQRGECKRLIITLPPRHLKSHIATISFVAWLLGCNPTRRVICASYGQELANTLARACRQVMASPWYVRSFGPILGPRQAVNEFDTLANGGRMSTSVGGALTGYGAHFIILDDPQKADDAQNEASRRAVIEWFFNTLISRLNSQRDGVIIVVAQCLHQSDLVRYLIEQGGWEVLKFPAIAVEDEQIDFMTPLGPRRFVRRTGEALSPGQAPIEALLALRKQMPPYDFSAQYQQNLMPVEGVLVNPAWFRRFNLQAFDHRSCMVYQSWDTANKIGELNDYSVCTTWARVGYDFYLIDVFRQKLSYTNLLAAIIAQGQKYRPTEILIEDAASGTQLIQELDSKGLSVRAIKPGNTNKIMRMRAQTTLFSSGRVYVPTEAPWLTDYLHELTTFPGSDKCDQVDSTSQALEFMRGEADEMGILARLCDN